MKELSLAGGVAAFIALCIAMILILADSPFPSQAFAGILVILAVVFACTRKRERPHDAPLSRVHFPGLNGIRFLAAFLVVVHHVEQVKGNFGFGSLWTDPVWGPFFSRAGALGVTFFFVLSGFLITYLLMVEQQATGSICLKEFYVRRALRIWPVYFLLTFLSFFLFPHIPLLYCPNMPPIADANESPRFVLFLLMLAHLEQITYAGVQYAGVLWSASVEEHFYFIWPLLVRVLKKRIIFALIGIIPILVVLKQILPIWYYWINPATSMQTLLEIQDVGTYFRSFRIDCMAIGGIGAWLCLRNSRVLPFLFHWTSQLALAVILIYCLFKGIVFGSVDDDVYSLFFLLLIVNVSVNPKTLLRLEHPVWDFLGRISYGLYAYNWIAIVSAINLMLWCGGISNTFLRNLYIYTTSYTLLVGLSVASYFLMERRFLKLKRHFGSLSKVGMDDAGKSA